MSILFSHAGSWHSDKWYRRAWYVWPQAISLLLVGWLFAGPLLKPIPWAPPTAPPAAKAPPTAPQPRPIPQADRDEALCLAEALNACSRLIDAGLTGFYFWRGQIYLRNEDYDRAIEDLSKFIQLNPKHVWALNDRGSAYEKKGELNKALADFREAQNSGSTTASEDINRVERTIESLRSKYVVNGLDGLSLGGRVSPQSKEYQEYQCTPSEQFDRVTWCNKQWVEEEARGSYRSSYTIAHSPDGTIFYLN